jgi:hypothetical protein
MASRDFAQEVEGSLKEGDFATACTEAFLSLPAQEQKKIIPLQDPS